MDAFRQKVAKVLDKASRFFGRPAIVELPPGNGVSEFRFGHCGSPALRDLKKESEAGNFRLDLFFRLSIIQVDIPPLRDRGDDVDERDHVDFGQRTRDPHRTRPSRVPPRHLLKFF